jgi:nitrite reductase (NO-forming)
MNVTGLDAPATARRGAPGRAAQAQRQAWRTLRVAVAFVAAAATAALVTGSGQVWLPVHLLLLGGVLGAISAATQLFAVTWSAAPAPSDRVAGAQRWLLAVGAAGVVGSRHLDLPLPAIAASGAAVLVALLLLAAILFRIRSTVATDRFVASIDCYLLALVLGLAGSGTGLLLAAGGLGTVAGARDAHIVLNLFGLVGLVVLGTLPTFVATQARTRVSPRLSPRRLRGLAVAMAAGTLAAATGILTGDATVGTLGFGLYAASAAGVVLLVPRLGPRQRQWAGPRLLQLLTGVGWWIATTGWAAASQAGVVPADRLWLVLAVGGYAQLVIASLAYLGPIIRGRDHEAQRRAFAITRSWPSLVAGNVAAVSISVAWWPVAGVALGVWALDVVTRATLLAVRVRPAPLPSRR